MINTAAIDKAVQAAMKAWKIPGVAVAVVQGDEVYLQGYGVKEVGTDDLITPNTLFCIASMTKAFTTTAMAILVDEGKMSWDDHPRKHLPWFKLSDPVADAGVTMRDLVSHRTGMARHDALWFATEFDSEEIVRRYGLAPSTHSFRSKYEYANVPYVAAGLAIGSASGSTWAKFVEKRILKPLGMGSKCLLAEAEKCPDHSHGHTKHKGKVFGFERMPFDCAAPAGAINASPTDMSKWIRMQLNGGEFDGKRIVSAEALAETRKPHIVCPTENPDKHGVDHGTNLESYCMGWSMCEYRGEIVVSHGGWVSGFTSNISLVPGRNSGFAVLLNLAYAHASTAIRNSLRDVLLDLPPRNWNADYKRLTRLAEKEEKGKAKIVRHARTRPSRSLDAYAGEYDNPIYGKLTIVQNDGRLNLHYGTLDYALSHFHYDTFSGKHPEPHKWDDIKVIFHLGKDGEVATIKIAEPWFDAEFKKVKQEQKP